MNTKDKALQAERLAAFETVVSEYEGTLIRYAARIVDDPDAAQDVVQDTFINLFRKWKDEMRPCPQVLTWLYRATHNRAVDHLRREHRLKSLHMRHAAECDEVVPADRGDGFRISEAAEQAVQVMHRLSLRERQLVILKVFEEKSYKDIAEITGLTPGHVGYILHHAMKKMARELRAGTVGDGAPVAADGPWDPSGPAPGNGKCQ